MHKPQWIILSALIMLTAVIVVGVAAHTHTAALAAGATPNPAIPHFTPAPRGPTAPAGTANAKGTAVPAGGSRTLPNGPPVSVLLTMTPVPLQGVPAITPTIATTDPLTPAFTQMDVIAYYAAHPQVGAKITTSGPVMVTKVDFMSARNARTALQFTALPDSDLLVCVVYLSGSYTVCAPGGPCHSFVQALEIFDAHTGNKLASG